MLLACSLLLLLGSSQASRAALRSLTQSCSTFCSDKAAGLYANPCDSTCTTFLQCSNGITYQMSCASGTVFNPSISNCDWPSNYACSGSGGPTPTPTPQPAPTPTPVPVPAPTPAPTTLSGESRLSLQDMEHELAGLGHCLAWGE